ncbi:MAG: hypothetical protein ACI837_000079 [Crocinitomicaceae bacterium]|jgi:hypothetical protein
MHKPILIVIAVCSLASCGEKVKEVVPVAQKGEDALIIGDPLDCGLDSLLVFPVGSSYIPEIIEGEPEPVEEAVSDRTYSENKVISLATTNASSNIGFVTNGTTHTDLLYDSGASLEYVNENSEDFDIRNLLFYDMVNKTSYPLMLDSMHILSFAIHREFEKPMIFYRVVKRDHNKDLKFNSLDPIMLYISDLDGRNFTQITPDNEHFIDYTFYKQTASILIKTVIDSNEDHDFASNDETNFRSMSITDPKMGKAIFSASFKDSLRVYNK